MNLNRPIALPGRGAQIGSATPTRTSQICIFNNEIICTLCTCVFHFFVLHVFLIFALHVGFPFLHVRFSFFTLRYRPRSFHDNKFLFSFFLSPNRLYQFNSKIARARFTSMMVWNKWKVIAEERIYIFWWRFPCLRSLGKLKNDATTMPQINNMIGRMRKIIVSCTCGTLVYTIFKFLT